MGGPCRWGATGQGKLLCDIHSALIRVLEGLDEDLMEAPTMAGYGSATDLAPQDAYRPLLGASWPELARRYLQEQGALTISQDAVEAALRLKAGISQVHCRRGQYRLTSWAWNVMASWLLVSRGPCCGRFTLRALLSLGIPLLTQSSRLDALQCCNSLADLIKQDVLTKLCMSWCEGLHCYLRLQMTEYHELSVPDRALILEALVTIVANTELLRNHLRHLEPEGVTLLPSRGATMGQDAAGNIYHQLGGQSARWVLHLLLELLEIAARQFVSHTHVTPKLTS